MMDTAKTYGSALYSLAQSEGESEAVLQSLYTMKEAFAQNGEYGALLDAPQIPFEERERLIGEALGDLHPFAVNTLCLLAKKKSASFFEGCVNAFLERYNADRGIETVYVTTAIELSDELQGKLCESLAKHTGKKITLCTLVDPSLLCGIKVRFQNTQIDESAHVRLEKILQHIKS